MTTSFIQALTNKLGIVANFEKLYCLIAEQLAVEYGYDENGDEEDVWGVEYTKLTIVRDGKINFQVDNIFEAFQKEFYKNQIKNLAINVRKEGRSVYQEWDYVFSLNLNNAEMPFFVDCYFSYSVKSGEIEDAGISVTSLTHTAEEVEKMTMFFILKN